ncbi:hypothetical protein [Clostridium sp.]|jgi:hypothetical protein|uniref:hypothetical protein n=1 Tax=Clostridium sp. TaxID=1506 RepID=UPI00258C7A83|nr:hypothetical protein [Clostridium sp.]MDF2504662.1 hypothetical protein [Clostridium sp.]
MEFMGKSLSGIFGLMIIAAVVLIGGYLLIHLIPLLIIVGVIIYAAIRGKRYFKEHFKKSESKINTNARKNYNDTSSFTSNDDLDGEVIDVEYKDV